MKAYSVYKDSGIEWLGEIPQSWFSTNIKRIATKVTDGSHFSPEAQLEGLPYVTVTNVGEKGIDLIHCKKIKQKDFIELEKNGCRPQRGDVLLTKDGTIGKSIVVGKNNNFVILSSIGLIRPNSAKIVAEYLKYYLVSGINIDQMFSHIRGSALTRLTIKLINELIIVVPSSLQEQKAIAIYLDNKTQKIDRVIEIKQMQVELLKEQRTAIINQAVTKGLNSNVKMKDSGIDWLGKIPEHWRITQLKRFTDKITDGAHISPDTENGIHPFISTRDLEGDHVNFVKCLLISQKSYDYLVKTSCQPQINDVLFSKDGTIGKTVVVDKHYPHFVIASSLIVIRPKTQVLHPRFLHFACQSQIVIGQINSFVKGSALKRISLVNIQKIIFVFPTLEEQESISEYLDCKTQQINKLVKSTQTQINQLKEYRTTLISELVTGKIDVRDEVITNKITERAEEVIPI